MRVRLDSARLRFVFLLPALCLACFGDELAEKGREIFKQNQRAIVTVQLVLKSKFSMRGMGGQSNESKRDVTGTVVDPSGLTILSLSGIEPGDMMQSFFGDAGDDDPKFKMETELGDVKILLEDGAELPAEVVLRDKDLDLAFIRPKTKPAAPMPSLDLANSGQAQVLDQVIPRPGQFRPGPGSRPGHHPQSSRPGGEPHVFGLGGTHQRRSPDPAPLLHSRQHHDDHRLGVSGVHLGRQGLGHFRHARS